ncbi:MAG: hypothetical protein IOD12_07970 [Silvanigrellales bacterium]|nr:hypothetical protein [Silvanigrellales bacterium]
MKPEITTKENYPYRAAGRIWNIPQIHFVTGPDGTLGISGLELERVHKAIANEICGNGEPLTGEEIEFLCGISGLSFSEVASQCGFNRANITYWRKKGAVNDRDSALLKRFFWVQLFSNQISTIHSVNVRMLLSEKEMLSALRDEAIREDVTFEVKLARAS